MQQVATLSYGLNVLFTLSSYVESFRIESIYEEKKGENFPLLHTTIYILRSYLLKTVVSCRSFLLKDSNFSCPASSSFLLLSISLLAKGICLDKCVSAAKFQHLTIFQ